MQGRLMKQQANLTELLKLIQENPDLPVIPMVDSQCVAGDHFPWWVASLGRTTIEELYIEDEQVFVKSKDYNLLVEAEMDGYSLDITCKEAESLAKKEVDAYKWKKVIAVKIEP